MRFLAVALISISKHKYLLIHVIMNERPLRYESPQDAIDSLIYSPLSYRAGKIDTLMQCSKDDESNNSVPSSIVMVQNIGQLVSILFFCPFHRNGNISSCLAIDPNVKMIPYHPLHHSTAQRHVSEAGSNDASSPYIQQFYI